MKRHFNVYHESIHSRAARPLDVRPCHWIRQAVVTDETEAVRLAKRLTELHYTHAKVTSRQGTILFVGRPTAEGDNV